MCEGWITTRVPERGSGTPVAGRTVYFRLIDPLGEVDAYDRVDFTATSDADGLVTQAFVRGGAYEARLDVKGAWTPFVAGFGSTFALPQTLGGFGR